MLTITIGRGSADGVQADMAVIAPAGVVGRIVGPPAAHASRVQLLIDRNAAAGALTERTRSGGMVVGSRPRSSAGDGSGVQHVGHQTRGSGDRVGCRRDLSEGICDWAGRVVRARIGPVSGDNGAAIGGFLEPGGGSRRARAASIGNPGRLGARASGHGRNREMKTAAVMAALAVALVLQTTLAGMSLVGSTRVNLVLVAVVYVALAYGAVFGLFAGCAAGLVQDAHRRRYGRDRRTVEDDRGFFRRRARCAVHRLDAGAAISDVLSVRRWCTSCASRRSTRWSSREGSRFDTSSAVIQALVNGAVGISAFLIVERGPEMFQRGNWRRSSSVRRRY